MLSPAARETWNDYEVVDSEVAAPNRIQSWTNINAFFARLTVEGIANYWNYGMWALGGVLEQKPKGDNAKRPRAPYFNANLPAPVVWIPIVGEESHVYASRI